MTHGRSSRTFTQEAWGWARGSPEPPHAPELCPQAEVCLRSSWEAGFPVLNSWNFLTLAKSVLEGLLLGRSYTHAKFQEIGQVFSPRTVTAPGVTVILLENKRRGKVHPFGSPCREGGSPVNSLVSRGRTGSEAPLAGPSTLRHTPMKAVDKDFSRQPPHPSSGNAFDSELCCRLSPHTENATNGLIHNFFLIFP